MLKLNTPTNLVTTDTAQTISGAKTFSSGVTISSGNLTLPVANGIVWNGLAALGIVATSTTTGVFLNSAGSTNGLVQPGLGGSIYKSVTAGNNTSTGETTLDSYSVAANLLNANGRGLRITAWGTFAANANTKTVRLKFGSTDLTSGAFTGTTNGGSWKVSATILRTGAATQTAVCDWGTTTGTVSRQGNVTSPAETLSGAVTLALTGQSGTASNDITSAALHIEFLN